MISGQSLTCPKGASLTFEIDMDTGSDLTGATAQWALCESWFDQAKVYLTKTGTSDGLFIGQDGGVWKITVNLAPTDTLDIPSGLLYHDCKVLLQNGDVEDVVNGPFILDPSVNILNTNAPSTRNLHGTQTLGSIGQTASGTVGAFSRSLQATQPLAGIGQTASASVAALTLPSGTLGVWNFDQYSATPSPNVPNAAVATPISANLFRASRRMFNNTEWWAKVSVTAVDDAVAGSDAIVDASTILGTGGWFLSPQSNIGARTIPAGTYTIGCSAKRNTGSDQSYGFSSDNTGSRSPVKTATSSWGRTSYTFILGSTTDVQRIGLCSSDGVTGANIQIRDLELYSGSSDLGPTAPDSHLYFGQTGFDTANVVASTGAVDLSSGGYGLIQFPDGAASGNFTAQAVLSKTVNSSTYESFLSRVQSYAQFSAMAGLNKRPAYNGNFVTEKYSGATQGAGLWSLYTDGYHVITYRYDGSQVEIYLDDIRLFLVTASPSFNLRDLFVNLTNSNALFGGLKYHAIAYWDRSLSNAEVVSSYSYWKTHAALSGITLSGGTTDRIVMFEGDSRTERNTGFAYIFGGNANPKVFGVNMAVSGSMLADLATRQSDWEANFPTSKNGRKFYVVIGPMGANDLAAYAGATDSIAAQNYANALAAISDTFYSYGADKVIVSTELAVSGATTHNARRALLNTIIKNTWPGSNPVSVADIASDATMGTDTSFTDHPINWDDGTHPNDAGHAILETYYRTIINALP